MITLKHLTIERFRLLREVDLHFPQRGCILIQGPNEAGKSALLESLYFALYGEPLHVGGAHREAAHLLDDLVLYGAADATVTLVLSVSTTELTVRRTIERGVGQKVVLQIRKLGMPDEEPITRLPTANARILAELGQIDGKALRNSCLIEQKSLTRLETLAGSDREETVRKLLGLEKLIHMTEHLKVTPQDEQSLQEAREQLHLAELQERIPILIIQLDLVASALDAVAVHEDLVEVDQQDAEVAEQEQVLQQLEAKRAELKGVQVRIQQLKTADATLGKIVATYDGMAKAQPELPILEKRLAELERREREELPVLEKHVSELVELGQSFGTLERMSHDLLITVDTVRDLEQELKQQQTLKDDGKEVDRQIVHGQAQVMQAQKMLQDLQEQRRARRPVLEERLERLKTLSEHLVALQQHEDRHIQLLSDKERAAQKKSQLQQVEHDLYEAEQELAQAETREKQLQQQVDDLEEQWRQVSTRRQLEEWKRLKTLSQELVDAEQRVRVAHEQQEKLTLAALTARRSTRIYMIIVATCIILFLLFAGIAALEVFQKDYVFALLSGIIVVVPALLGAGLSLRNYRKARVTEQVTDRQMQEAVSTVGTAVAAREAAAHVAVDSQALNEIEGEIATLGGPVPRSLTEAQSLLLRLEDQGQDAGDIQQHLNELRDEADVAQDQVNVSMGAAVTLRKERESLQEQRLQEDWDHVEEKLHAHQATFDWLHQEITLLATQEGFPLPSINERVQSETFSPLLRDETLTGIPSLEAFVASSLSASQSELASLDSQLVLMAEREVQVNVQQDALDVLLARKQTIEERSTYYRSKNLVEQIQHAREQHIALRSALLSLQDSLRLRVKPLGVLFGQTAVNNAEQIARRQLEELHILLGQRVIMQQQCENHSVLVKARQESLGEHYQQLAKLSNSLGSWIVPPNPFPEALAVIRTHCQDELREADEPRILQELEQLQIQEWALQAKNELCSQVIADAHERIATILLQQSRPSPKSYALRNIIAIWPLLGDYSVQDRNRLEVEQAAVEEELIQLEKEEFLLAKQLQTEGMPLDLPVARARLEQLEGSYQMKKHGNLLVQAVNKRLMSKLLPRTEFYMQQILPLLTSGRYHDIHVTTDIDEDTVSAGPFQLSVWDSAANEYVPKSALSGGASDQLSLALRLAFAITVLPRDLNPVPGFMLLDEPLSSFDHGRTQALVNVLTGELLSQHFEQILLISHSSAFDPTMFPYHIYMDNGLIVESNLPFLSNVSPANSSYEYECVSTVTAHAHE